MNKLHLYVCENYLIDYKKAAEPFYNDGVEVCSFPCVCCGGVRPEIKETEIYKDTCEKVLICGSNCPFLKEYKIAEASAAGSLTVKTNNFCFNHFLNEKLIERFISKGCYIITVGWLKKWNEHLKNNGFDRETARHFFADFCREILLLNTGTEPDILSYLDDFSEYINIPYSVLDTGIDELQEYVENIVCGLKTNGQKGYLKVIAELKQQTAEYATMLSMIEQITSCTTKREVIEKTKELFRVVIGARSVNFYSTGVEFEELQAWFTQPDKDIEVKREEKTMLIRLKRQDDCFGIITAGDLLFPGEIDRYSYFASSVVRVSSLSIANTIKYEIIEKAKNEMTYLSYHDSLTGLYNRGFIKNYIENNELLPDIALFMCDVDGLKFVNDNLGHTSGDEKIVAAANTLSRCFRETDLVARIGGDEFCVLMKNCLQADAKEALNRIQRAIDNFNINNPDKPYKLSISVGMFHLSENIIKNITWDNAFAEADKRMYEVKAAKKSRDNSR
jgi:diguanylate cyclase (GGDEF)-like protein